LEVRRPDFELVSGPVDAGGGGAEEVGAAIGGDAAAEGVVVGGGGGADADEGAVLGGGGGADADEGAVLGGGGGADANECDAVGIGADTELEKTAANERGAVLGNGRGEYSPCAIFSSRIAALRAASAVAAAEASAIDFAEVNDSGGAADSEPKTRGGAICGRGVLDDAVPESGGVAVSVGHPRPCGTTRI
jgi:hypothetical protein